MAIDKVTTFKLFVKNLPDGYSEEELKAIFENYGRVVECKLLKNRTSLAFVHMEEEVCARNAINELNGRSINGIPIGVEESKQTDHGPSLPTTRLRVKNIPNSLQAKDLRNLFTKFGLVLAAEVTNQEGIVNIEATGDLRSAIKEVNGSVYDGKTLVVEPMIDSSVSITPRIRNSSPMQQNGRPQALLPKPVSGRGRGRGPPPKSRLPPASFSPYPEFEENNFETPDYFHDSYEESYNTFNPEFRGPPRPGTPGHFGRPPPAHFGGPPPGPWHASEESEGRVLRDPYGPGLRPAMGMGMQRPLMRPPIPSHGPGLRLRQPFSPARPLLRGPGVLHQQTPRPLLSRPMHLPSRPMHQPPRPLMGAGFPQNPRLEGDIEPLFRRRHEILDSGPPSRLSVPSNNQNFYDDEIIDESPFNNFQHQPDRVERTSNQNFYDDEIIDQTPFNDYQPDRVERVPIFRNNGGFSNNGMSTGRSMFQPPAPLKRFPAPFRGGPPVKRISVPEAAPGEPFQAPAMIPPGTFQPPKKYFLNRPKNPNNKKKKNAEYRPEPPIPEQIQRHVPDFSMQKNQLPQGAILRPFPPPLMNQDFSEDPEFY